MANITGTQATEILNGTSSIDTIAALGGSDQISGLGGADKYINQARNMTGETGPISGMSQVQGMFSKLGISPEQGAELTRNFGSFVGSRLGGPLGEAVTGVMK